MNGIRALLLRYFQVCMPGLFVNGGQRFSNKVNNAVTHKANANSTHKGASNIQTISDGSSQSWCGHNHRWDLSCLCHERVHKTYCCHRGCSENETDTTDFIDHPVHATYPTICSPWALLLIITKECSGEIVFFARKIFHEQRKCNWKIKSLIPGES